MQPNPGVNDVRIHTCMDPGIAVESTMGEPVTREEVRQELGETRRFQLLRGDVRKAAEKIGYTADCAGCRGVKGNYVSRPMHSEACRVRMEAEIRKTPRGQERMGEFENRLAREVEQRVSVENKIAKNN